MVCYSVRAVGVTLYAVHCSNTKHHVEEVDTSQLVKRSVPYQTPLLSHQSNVQYLLCCSPRRKYRRYSYVTAVEETLESSRWL
jgi:hypothetical protein